MVQLGMKQWAMVDAISIAYVMASSTRQRRRQASKGDPLGWGIKVIGREPIRGEGEARIWAFAGAFSDQFQIRGINGRNSWNGEPVTCPPKTETPCPL